MAESLTISRQPQAIPSMNYPFLREKGINRLQELSGNVWNDFNIHDPGVTLLEALAYAITDLGYRSSYKIQDILANDPNSSADIRNFFSAYQILTNRALTPDDYRKLLIDVQVTDPVTGAKAGVKNAWLMKALESEIPFYVHGTKNKLDYSPDPLVPPVQQPVRLKGLYNVLLEFDENDRFGDMNENFLTGEMKIGAPSALFPLTCTASPDAGMLYKDVVITVGFPHWDDARVVNWNDPDDIRSYIDKRVTLEFVGLPDSYIIDYAVDPGDGSVILGGGVDTDYDGTVDAPFNPITSLACLQDQVNDFIFNTTNGLIAEYQKKVNLIFRLLGEVRRTLMASRNLCEDFLRLSAVKVEEIAMCGDIELENGSDIETVMADIFHRIGEFLSPTVYFHTIEEMVAKGRSTEEIFEGPRLRHGFIDDEELKKSGFRESIHVSDLYQIIMDVPGVIAVKNLQIANFPEQTTENIPTVSVKWCLGLAFAKNFVPRLSVERSSITFFKGLLPFQAKPDEVLERLATLRALDPPQRLENPVLDLPIPEGEFRDIDDYVSVQEEFPLVYGIGSEGLPNNATDLRKSQAHQLKGFLMFFDQLLGDYLSQLSHIKDLFSLNDALDNDGNFVIDRTYFTRSLLNIVPDAADLYVNSATVHDANLLKIAESEEIFEDRRNRFLDHLLARFAESFADYALLAYKLDGPKAPEELIEDKLDFLNAYPELSYHRAGGFDYEDTCEIWSIDNVSGVEKRVSLLTGIDPVKPSDLSLPVYVDIIDTAGTAPFSFQLKNLSSVVIMDSIETYATIDEVFLAVEQLLLTGLFTENYFIFDINDPDTPVDPASPPAGPFIVKLFCHGQAIAISTPPDFLTVAAAQTVIAEAAAACMSEYQRVPPTNRKDLDCALEDNVDITVVIIEPTDDCPRKAEITYTILNDLDQPLLTYVTVLGSKTGESAVDFAARVDEEKHDIFLEFILRAANRDVYRFEDDGGDYIFAATDTCQQTIAKSDEIDFNSHLAARIGTGTVNVYDANGSFAGNFAVASSTDNEDKIEITLTGATLTPAIAGGKITKDFTASVLAGDFDPLLKRFIVNEDLRGCIKAGDVLLVTIDLVTPPVPLTVTGLRIIDFTLAAYRTEITVKESFTVTPASTATFPYTVSLPIIALDNPPLFPPPPSDLVLKGGVEEIALDEFLAFITAKFLDREGFHLVEHILLRPTTKLKRWDPSTITTLTESLTQEGDIYFLKTVNIVAVDIPQRIFTVTGDVTAELVPFQNIVLAGSNLGLNDRSYIVQSVTLNGSDTDIKVTTAITDNTVPYGDITFTKKSVIGSVVAADKKVNIPGDDLVGELDPGDVFILKGSQDGINDTRYTVLSVTYDPVSDITEIVIDEVEVEYKDDFLPINVEDSCEDCRYTDPYSFIVTAVLPHWRGRFSNFAFRKFFERTLRLETPAHVVVNICWVSCEQMAAFESRYKLWLYLRAKKEKDPVAISNALNAVIDILGELRTVYNKGTLHDCEFEEVRNSIILNQTQLGTS